MQAIQVRPLSEADIDYALEAAGGTRAHPDADRRTAVGADYKLGRALIELKALDEEGFSKPERQRKLAALFGEYEPRKPVVVLDRKRLEPVDQTRFDRIVEGPIKTAVGKASKQLKQSRSEHPDTDCTVLLIVNNGYTTLDQEALKNLVAHRVRQDTREIDAVVVAGAYYHSDGFDTFFLWPTDYVPINLDRPFAEFEKLREGWNQLANRFMTEMMIGESGAGLTKGPVVDTQFDVDGTTFIRPAPVLGRASDFYVHGRPRNNSTGLTVSPKIGVTFPLLSRREWERFSELLADRSQLSTSYEAWKRDEQEGREQSDPLKPFVTVPLTPNAFEQWCTGRGLDPSVGSIFECANDIFGHQARDMIVGATDRATCHVVPSRYVIAVTDIIGQDCANDVSEVLLVREQSNGESRIRSLLGPTRIIHEHAVGIAAAYAIREGVETVMWFKDQTYAWV
ncbi:hypothetical protein [Brevundimonas naejangsanensis]|uniref:hypothetical protein n=1 Tax=Brevundimonas naejangsanensis TaxID=588932 RepID=UPI00320A4B3A